MHELLDDGYEEILRQHAAQREEDRIKDLTEDEFNAVLMRHDTSNR